jgi:uncharacterized protein
MRLTPDEVEAIKAAARETFGDDVVVRLFGSRVHDHLKGGDIDLHFEIHEGLHDVGHAADFRWRLFKRIPERKVDLVFGVRGREARPIDRIALAEGEVL